LLELLSIAGRCSLRGLLKQVAGTLVDLFAARESSLNIFLPDIAVRSPNSIEGCGGGFGWTFEARDGGRGLNVGVSVGLNLLVVDYSLVFGHEASVHLFALGLLDLLVQAVFVLQLLQSLLLLVGLQSHLFLLVLLVYFKGVLLLLLATLVLPRLLFCNLLLDCLEFITFKLSLRCQFGLLLDQIVGLIF